MDFWSRAVCRAAGRHRLGRRLYAGTESDRRQSRGQRAIARCVDHAAGVGVAGAASYRRRRRASRVCSGRQRHSCSAASRRSALVAIALFVMPNSRTNTCHSVASPRALLDFRPVFRNRAALAWIAGYTVHTWEMAGLRAWGVTFLTLAVAQAGAPQWLPSPTVIFTVAGFVGIAVSIFGNEMSQRYGRIRIVTLAMTIAAVLASLRGLDHRLVFGPRRGSHHRLARLHLPGQFGTDGRHGAGRRSRAARRHHGAAQHVRLCRRLPRPARRRLRARSRRKQSVLGWGLGFGQLALISVIGLAFVRRLG